MQVTERRSYSKEFKYDAVKLTNSSNKTVREIASDLGISPEILSKWRRKSLRKGKDAFPGHGNMADREKLLEKELRQVREERDILKKALAIFSKPQGRSTDL